MSKKAEEVKYSAMDIAETISKGEAPSNVQIERTLEKTEEAIEEQKRKVHLDTRGQKLAEDAERILESTKQFLKEKNPDESFQKLYKDTTLAAEELQKKGQHIKGEIQPELEQLQFSAQDVYEVARRVSFELVRSKDFRILLVDSAELVQRIFWNKIQQTVPSFDTSQMKEALKKDFIEGQTAMPETRTEAIKTKEEIRQQMPEHLPELTENERNEIWQRSNAILKRISQNPDYHRAVNGLFTLVDHLKGTLQKVSQTSEQQLESKKIQKTFKDAQVILERFTGSHALNKFINDLKQFLNDINSDQRMRNLFDDWRNFIKFGLENPSELGSDERRKRFNELVDRSRDFMYEPKFRDYSSLIFDELRNLLNKITEDETTKQIGDAFTQFFKDFALDKSGQPSVGAIQDSLIQMKNLLLPVVLQQFQAVPVARIEGSNPTYDYILDNITFSAYDVLPEQVKLYFDSKVAVNLKEAKTDKAKALLRLEILHIKPHLKNIQFAYRRKSIPKMEDEGVADVDVTGEGLNMYLMWEVKTSTTKPMRFKLKECRSSVDSLKINVKQAIHSWLDRVFGGLFVGQFKKNLEQEIDSNLCYLGRRVAYSFNTAIMQVGQKPITA